MQALCCNNSRMARTEPQINIRIPAELKAALDREAEASRRSLTAEIVARLQASLAWQANSAGVIAADSPEAQQRLIQELRTRQALVLGRRETLHGQRFTMQIQMGMADRDIQQLEHTARTVDPHDRDAMSGLVSRLNQVRHSVNQLEREIARVEEEIDVCDAEMLNIDRTLEQITGEPQVLIRAYLARDGGGLLTGRAAGASLPSRASATTPEQEHTAPAKKARAPSKKVSQR